jgi:hypothetical protein
LLSCRIQASRAGFHKRFAERLSHLAGGGEALRGVGREGPLDGPEERLRQIERCSSISRSRIARSNGGSPSRPWRALSEYGIQCGSGAPAPRLAARLERKWSWATLKATVLIKQAKKAVRRLRLEFPQDAAAVGADLEKGLLDKVVSQLGCV